jgi:tRNA G18 (ribose-2'-O)-methylase SpoU
VFTLHEIKSFDSPALQPYRTMRRQLDQRQQGIFVAEGEKVVRRLLESELTVVSVLLPGKWFENLRPLIEGRPEDIEVFVAPKELLETLTGFSMYQGLLAVGKVPVARTLDQILRARGGRLLCVAADGLSSAQNMGVLVRNCAAFGAAPLIVGESSSSPYLRRAVRSSMGTVFRLPVIEAESLARALGELRAGGVRIIGAHPQAGSVRVEEADLAGDCCIVFGSEGYGLSAGVLALCDQLAAIPMVAGVDSLNVGSAAAIFLFEAARRRRLG